MLKKMKEELKNEKFSDYWTDKEEQWKKRMAYLLKQADVYSHFIWSKDSVVLDA